MSAVVYCAHGARVRAILVVFRGTLFLPIIDSGSLSQTEICHHFWHPGGFPGTEFGTGKFDEMDGLESDNWLGDLDFQSSVLWHFGSPFHHLAVDLVQHGNFYTDPALLNVNGAVNVLPDFAGKWTGLFRSLFCSGTFNLGEYVRGTFSFVCIDLGFKDIDPICYL